MIDDQTFIIFYCLSIADNSEKLSDASPVGSIASAEIASEFATLTAEEQELQRAEWSQVLSV